MCISLYVCKRVHVYISVCVQRLQWGECPTPPTAGARDGQLTSVPIFCFLPILPRMLLRPPPAPAPAAAAGRFMPLGKGKNKQEQCKGKNKQELCKGKNKQQLCRKCHCCNEGHRRNNDNTMEPLLRDCPSHRYRFQNTSSDGNLQSVFLNWPRKYSDTVGVMYFSHSSRMALPLLNCQSSVLTSVSLSSFGGGGGGGTEGSERERRTKSCSYKMLLPAAGEVVEGVLLTRDGDGDGVDFCCSLSSCFFSSTWASLEPASTSLVTLPTHFCYEKHRHPPLWSPCPHNISVMKNTGIHLFGHHAHTTFLLWKTQASTSLVTLPTQHFCYGKHQRPPLGLSLIHIWRCRRRR